MGPGCPCPMQVTVLEPAASFWEHFFFVKVPLAFFSFAFLARMPLLGIKARALRTESKCFTFEGQP